MKQNSLLKRIFAIVLCTAFVGGTAAVLPLADPDINIKVAAFGDDGTDSGDGTDNGDDDYGWGDDEGDDDYGPDGFSKKSFTNGDFEYKTHTTGIVKIVGYSGTASAVTLPGTIEGSPVVFLGEEVFKGNTTLKSVVFPNSVQLIGSRAFSGCTSLNSVSFGSGLLDIDSSAFAGCTSLKTVSLPDDLERVSSGVFEGCTSLTQVTVGSKATSIGDRAFYGCTSLNSVVLGNSVASIGDCAFEQCTNLNSLTYNDGLESIGTGAFRSCSSLSEVSLPDSVTNIGSDAFRYCTSLTDLSLGNSLSYVGESAFLGCKKLQVVEVPSSLEEIPNHMFSECPLLSQVVIPYGVTSVSSYAFYSCPSLGSIEIPDSVVSIGTKAFGYNGSDNGDTKINGFKIVGSSDTAAERYATENGFDFNNGESDPLVNESTVSTQNASLYEKVTLTGAASGGKGNYKYAFYFRKSGENNWKIKGTEFGSETTAILQPGSATTYEVKIVAKDASNKTDEKLFRISVSETAELKNNSYAGAQQVKVLDKVTLYGSASGGTGSYKYAFYFRKSGEIDWKVKGTEFGTSTTAVLQPGTATTYEVKVVVKDSSGNKAESSFRIVVNDDTELTNKSSVSATTAAVGDKIKLTGAASGGKGTYKYAFYFKKGDSSTWSVKGTEFGTDSVAYLNPGTATDYVVKIVVKDSDNKTAEKIFKISVSNSSVLKNNSKVSTLRAKVGQNITLTGAASGGKGSYKYAFYFRRSGEDQWKVKGTEYGSDTTAVLSPGKETTYEVKIVVADASKNTVEKNFEIVVAGENTLVNQSSLSASTITFGKSVTLKGAASGGKGSYKYAFYFRKDGEKSWKVKGTEFGTDTTATLTPGTATNYEVRIVVKDADGKTAEKSFMIDVVSGLNNTSKISSSIVKFGNNITLSASAEGGKTSYKYAFYFRKKGENNWKVKGTEFGTSSSAVLIPGTMVDYEVKIVVKDSAGTTAATTFEVTVTK